MDPSNKETSFRHTGAVEQDRPAQKTNVAPFTEQFDHRYQDPLNKANDSGKANRGQTPEFTGESEGHNELANDTQAPVPAEKNPEGETVNQDPGEHQKENQNEQKDDPLAA